MIIMGVARARTLMAKYQALTTASEMIRGHKDVGFSYDDEQFDEVYDREIKKLSQKLLKTADKYLREYENMGIKVDLSTENSR